jgi:hypothetical protein
MPTAALPQRCRSDPTEHSWIRGVDPCAYVMARYFGSSAAEWLSRDVSDALTPFVELWPTHLRTSPRPVDEELEHLAEFR